MPKFEKFGLPLETIKKIHGIFKLFSDIELVFIYGSRAKGNFFPGSDIDLTIMGEKVDYTQMLKIEVELDDLLLPYKIDLSLFQQIENRELIEHINRFGQIFYKKA